MDNKKKKEKKIVPPEGMALLITADDKIAADVLESKLEAYGIQTTRKYRETGAYLTILLGNSAYGIDIFVPADKLDEAKDIIASAEEIKDEDILSDPSFSDEALKKTNEELLKKLDNRAWLMAGVFIIAIAVLIIYLILQS
jgi:hypothetical protein